LVYSEENGERMRRFSTLIFCLSAGLLAAGCPKGKTDYSQGRKAEHLQDYDAAYDYYQKALKHDPENAEYLINSTRRALKLVRCTSRTA